MTLKLKYLAPALLLAASLPAQATLIDFTASNSSVVTRDGVTATVTARNGSLTWTNFDGDSTRVPCNPVLLACRYDGIGVTDDEITYGSGSSAESITVTFSRAVDITNIYLFDLFGRHDDEHGNPAEIAMVLFRDDDRDPITTWQLTGTAAPGTLSGFATRSGFVSNVSSIRFYTNQVRNSDFAVAGLEFVSVPEPATLTLLGGGLIAFGLTRRRRRTV